MVVLLSGTEDDIVLPHAAEYAHAPYEFVWIAEGADADVRPGTTVKLPPNCRFDFSLIKSQGGGVAEFDALYDDTLADFWIDTCSFCEAINNARPRGAPAILPDPVLCDAANILSQEECSGASRPNGRDWTTAIKEAGLENWSLPDMVYGNASYSEIQEYLERNFVGAETTSEVQGQYYTRMGAARWFDYDNGIYFWQVILIIP